MAQHCVLIDYENVQPSDLCLLHKASCRVYVFVGKKQKLSVECASALQPLGDRGRYIQITGNGRNALDFHIAFYLGELAARDATAIFSVISKDTGFDPLIEHLKACKVRVRRCVDIRSVVSASPKVLSREELLASVIEDLRKRGHARPRTEKTLARALVARFPRDLEVDTVPWILEALRKDALIAIENGRVAYRL